MFGTQSERREREKRERGREREEESEKERERERERERRRSMRVSRCRTFADHKAAVNVMETSTYSFNLLIFYLVI